MENQNLVVIHDRLIRILMTFLFKFQDYSPNLQI